MSARDECPVCGWVWTMSVNTRRPDWEEAEKATREKKMHLETVCEPCRSRTSWPRREGG